MKKLLKAYLWAEVLFVGYLILKPKSAQPSPEEQALDDLKNRLKKEIENASAQNP